MLALARLKPRPIWSRILIGVVGAGAALLVRTASISFYGEITGFMILLPGVILAALAGGRLSGATAVVASLLGGWAVVAFSLAPGSNMVRNLGLVSTVNFVIVGLFCTWLGASLRRTLARLDSVVSDLSLSNARIDETEGRLQVVSELAPVMLWMTDETDHVIHLNSDQRLFWGRLSHLGDFDAEAILHPEDRDRITAVGARAAQERTAYVVEGRHRRHDGEWRVLRTEARPRLAPDGRFMGMIGVNIDVTDARAADAALRDSEQQLKATVEQASAGIARIDIDGRITSANARFAEILGRPVEALLGIRTADVTHPDDVAPTLSVLQAAAVGGPGGQIEKRYIRPDGAVVWALTSLRALTDGKGDPDGFIGVVVDITAAKAAEAALRDSETRFRLLADTAPSPVWLTDVDGGIEFANVALTDFYGLAPGGLSGQGWKQTIHPDDQPLLAAAQAEARPARQPYGLEARFRRHDGDWRWLRIAVEPRFDETGAFLGYVGIAFDTTDHREALEAAARTERRQAFLLDLSDRLRDLTDPDQIMAEVEASVGDLLEADRVGYGEVDQEAGVVSMSRDWTAGVVSAQGQFSLHAFGEALITDLAEGRTIRIDDVREDPRTAGFADAFAALQTRALIRAPLIRAGRLRAFLYVHAAAPRHWTQAEARLVEEIAARTWTEVERARAEADKRESEQRFRAVADTAPVLIWVTRQDRQRSFVNQAYVDFFGADYETARAADWRANLHPDDHARILQESVAGEATGEPFSLEARYRRHDGEWRWLKSFSRPRLSGSEVVGFVGVAFDVSDMREAQDRLVESESRFRTVADSAPALIWMTDATPTIIFANKRYRVFCGIRSQRQLADSWRTLIHPDDEPVFDAAFIRAFQARDRFEALSRVNHPTLGLRWIRTEGVPRFDASGAFQGYVGASLDVTDAKKAEDDLKRINELLEERVGAALTEKAAAEAHLMHAQRMEAVGRLTGGVAHDFNNLLTVVIGALDIILRSDDPAKRKKLGEAALSAARRGESLTHQLLAFSRRQALRPEAIDLNGLIREGEPLLRRAVGEAVDFKIRLKRGGARVNVDPAQFEAALLNLIVNARDALGDVTGGQIRDGARIVVQTMNCSIAPGQVAELSSGDYVCVTVTDNGAGMSPEVIDRVFEPFFTTKSVGKGTGLGLSQVYGFARQSGGGVHISSTVGRGTEIRLYLPPLAGQEIVVPVVAPAGVDASFAKGSRMLLVEDDASVAAVALDLLESFGLEVELAENGPDALRALEAARFDVMLTDVVMPGGMSGVDLARQAARDWPQMRIALTSGYVGDDVDQVLAGTPWPFLRKPYSTEQLRGVIAGAAALPAE
ncbi:PAS domain S-box protein [Brevundimonas sp.]|uniref:PAS domain S-box protein n=1 Tax=Brevundimonas sp. TaxID=1871086 RepID=UPI0037BE2D86